MTGSAAININGETTHKACSLNCKLSNIKRDNEWVENACLLIVDEVSFASNENLTKLNQCLNLLCDKPPHKLFGDIPMVFVGDFSQLKPVKGRSIENLFVSTWSYTSNWIYVVLSRVKTSKGLFTRIPLLHSKTNTPENMKDITKINEFHAFSRRTKKP
jgi:hypothetical protein